MAYQLQGQLLEVCDCRVLCPCWIGEAPDNGTCKGFVAWHFQEGSVNGVDVGGRTLVALAAIPGNVLDGNWRAAIYLDDQASSAQEQALLDVYTGKLGGPVGDLVKLIGEVVSVEKVPIEFDIREGKGRFRVGSVGSADIEPYQGPHGGNTVLSNSIFSTVPGSPAYVGKASTYTAKNEKLGIDLHLSGHNAITSTFRFDA